MRLGRVAIYGLLCALVVACGGSPPAPVEDRNRYGGTPRYDGGHVVQRGDTLYSIAFRYGLDYRRLAAANRIAAPYTIYPGQRLRLAEADPPARSAAPPPSVPAATTTAANTAPPATPAPSAASAPKPATPAPKPPVAAVKQPQPSAGTAPVSRWRWPSTGQVVRKYSATVHKGIDIGGKAGDPVVAVASGVVVYAGTGIVGLGELLIVKHNDVYLSAYGHNRRLLVGEGDTVRAGQKIAEKGSSGTDRVALHFEIRKHGKPVDPLRLLPRR